MSKGKQNSEAAAANSRRRAVPELLDFRNQRNQRPMMAELYRRAEARLRTGRRGQPFKPAAQKSDADTRRLLHELEIHQIELEMQNAELLKARNELEAALENYTDLYDFAPVGYFSVDEAGVILEANLTGASLLGMERSRLLKRRLPLLLPPPSRSVFLGFLLKVFATAEGQSCEAQVLKAGGGVFWAGFRATPVPSNGSGKHCRVAFADITASKEAREAQSRAEALAEINREQNLEIARRRKTERALLTSEQEHGRLLDQSRRMQGQLRRLSHQVLGAQEEERKRISRELHDVIAQSLVGINVHLTALCREAAPGGLRRKIARTQQLVQKSVDVVHRFARELRPTVLDDLGLIPALHAFLKELAARTGVRARLTAFAAIEKLDIARRTVLYRVAHEALNNVARHAHASRVDVSITQLPDRVCMKIKDDGKSFQVRRVLDSRGNKRLGLLGMRERLEMVGGSFAIESVPGQGTTVTAEIPVGASRAQGKTNSR